MSRPIKKRMSPESRIKMNKLRPLTTAALALWFLTLGAAAQKSEAPAPDYFPLRVGDSWTYRSKDGDTEHTLKVLSEEKQADGTIRYLVEKLAGAKVLTVFSKAGGWVLLHSERYPEHEGLEVKYEPAKQYLPDPLVAGAKWAWKGKDYTQTDLDENHQVVGFEDVTVLAGKFRAMKVVSRIVGRGAHDQDDLVRRRRRPGEIRDRRRADQVRLGTGRLQLQEEGRASRKRPALPGSAALAGSVADAGTAAAVLRPACARSG